MYGFDGVVVGRMKQKTEKYKEVVRKLLNKQELTAEEKAMLEKDGIAVPKA